MQELVIKKEIPIYGDRWKLIFVDSLTDIEEKYDLSDVSETHAVSFGKNGWHHTAFQIEDITPGGIAHEAKHLVNGVFFK